MTKLPKIKTKRKTCPFDKLSCDAKNDSHDIGDWISGTCRHGGYNEEDNSQPPCEKMSEEYRFMDRKKKISKAKPKRKVVKKCRCK